MAAASSSSTTGSSSSSREGSAKAMVADQISQTVQSTSNLLHLMLQSSPSQAHLIKLPQNLLAKTSTVKNTKQVLEQLPRVISALDAHTDNGLQSVPHLKTVIRLLANIESCQLKPLSRTQPSSEEPELTDQQSEEGYRNQSSEPIGGNLKQHDYSVFRMSISDC